MSWPDLQINSQPENLKNMKTAKQPLETYLAAISACEMESAIALFAEWCGRISLFRVGQPSDTATDY